DLLLVAQPSRTVVCQDRAGRDRTRRLHLGTRSEEKAHAIHPSVQPAGQTREVEILRSLTTDYSCFNRYSPLASLNLPKLAAVGPTVGSSSDMSWLDETQLRVGDA